MRALISVFAAFCLFATIARGELRTTQVNGEALPPGTMVLTIDDGPYEPWQSAPTEPPSWTIAIADFLATVKRPDANGNMRTGVPAAWFLVSCHFATEPPPAMPPPASVLCDGLRDQDEGLLDELLKLGFVVANHTHSHIPASIFAEHTRPKRAPEWGNEDLFRWDLCQTQHMLERHSPAEHFLFRAPGLDWPEWAAEAANRDPCLSNLEGPVGIDVGGGMQAEDGTWVNGDWDCPGKGLTPEACGDLYLNAIRGVTAQHGAIVLLHNYVIPGAYAMALIRYIIAGLDPSIQIVDIRTHPAFQGLFPDLRR